MQKQKIATTLLVALLIGGTVACTKSNSSEATPPSSSASTSNTDSNTPQSQEREQNRQALQKQIEVVLTPDQVKQFQVKLKQGEKMRKSLSDLDLTSEQKTKIQEIFKAARAKRQEQHQNNPQ